MKTEKTSMQDPLIVKNTRENSIGWKIKSLTVEFDKRMNEALKPFDINMLQFGILMTLAENNGLTQSEIGKQISMPGYATTRNIDVLESKSLVARNKHQSSRRSFSIELTSQGRSLLPSLFKIIESVNSSGLAQLNEHETQLFGQLLDKLLNNK